MPDYNPKYGLVIIAMLSAINMDFELISVDDVINQKLGGLNKDNLPLTGGGGLPILYLEGRIYHRVNPILRYLGIKSHFYSNTFEI